MSPFRRVLVNTLVASATTNFLWFAITFWMYLETRSVIATAVLGAFYPILTSVFGVVFGTYVDHHPKRAALTLSSTISLAFFAMAGVLYLVAPAGSLTTIGDPRFWLFVVLVMVGAVAMNLRMITLSTLVTLLVPEGERDRANGQVGIVTGLSFAITSVFSGLAIAFVGMGWSIAIAVVLTAAALLDLHSIHFRDEVAAAHVDGEPPKRAEFRGSIQAVKEVPGLAALIFFSLLNNFLGGVYFALLDPYGLELVAVQAWGFIWGGLSLLFLVSGLVIATRGLGSRPLRRLFQANLVMWVSGMLMAVQPSIILLSVGLGIYMLLVPVAEAAEQTVLQRVVPLAKQGRVFGFATSVENLATPVTALGIGPVAQFIAIPYMTTGGGADAIGSWFGTGVGRGIALIFLISGFLGVVITSLAFGSSAYRRLSRTYADSASRPLTSPSP